MTRLLTSATSRETLVSPAFQMLSKVYVCYAYIKKPMSVWTTADFYDLMDQVYDINCQNSVQKSIKDCFTQLWHCLIWNIDIV